ncbi:LysR family transcriptional regulator [Arthrobacter luteolus]|uniref:LysR family transcriptional regulator n=1 Tax=Arthrobacter luteolus TaxID=98672 RepID=UPI000A432D29|nr:LysR substrate-binding domain-containing protein [Arthrobacter luteolus]
MTGHLNLAHVRSLEILIEEGSFSKAAARLHVTAPAMTQQIKRLEGFVGYGLVERGQPVRLTVRGQRFMLHAKEALDASGRALGSHIQATLRIGFINGYPRGMDEEFLVELRRSNPELLVDFVELGWGDQTKRLLTGDIDASLGRPPFDHEEAIERITVYREPRVVAVPAGSNLAVRGSLILADIEGCAVVRARGAAEVWTKYWVVDPRPSGVPVNYGSWARTMEEALTAVAMSNNIMITAESVAERYKHPGVTYLPLDDASYCQVDLCTRKSDRRAVVRALRLSAEGAASWREN